MIRLVLECYAPGDEANQWCWPNCACDDAYLSGELRTILAHVDANRECSAVAMRETLAAHGQPSTEALRLLQPPTAHALLHLAPCRPPSASAAEWLVEQDRPVSVSG
jgi:hypothetical protein